MNELRCDCCGKFLSLTKGPSWADQFDGYPHYGLSKTDHRCVKCTNDFGPVESNATPYRNTTESYQGIIE